MNDDRSVLVRMEEQGRKAPRLSLNGTVRDEKARERYEILGELARGGIGVVHRGRDNDVGRDVALKVLLDRHLKSPELIQRFVEEAQIGGQLQHPGIVPVYELGLRADERPYFAMKLVKGETLAARLAKRADPADERRELLAVFRDVCRTTSYAHSRGVIHRDLKPSNVMIGNFGEVQVVDWGFAKVLARGGLADEGLARKAERDTTMVSTVRSEGSGTPSVAGSVMGTPAYMPPEQALGRVDDLDERSDLFSLGAILCEILTGAPPYTGDDRMEDAIQARLDSAHARLDRCDADGKLVALCRRCLEPLPKDRPASAESLADAVASYLTNADHRAHRARVRALKAGARATEQRRRRRLTSIVGGSAVAAVVLAVGAYLLVDAGRVRRERDRRTRIEAALQDATRLRAASRFAEALAAAERAVSLGDDGALAEEIRAEADEAARIRRRREEEDRLLAELEEVRAMTGDHYGEEEVEAAWTAAIRRVWPSMEVDTARLRESEDAEAFAAAFDNWALARRDGWEKVDAWARAIDPEHDDLRDALADRDGDAVAAFVARVDLSELTAARIATVGSLLARSDRREAALEFLRRAARLHPGDFWIHMRLAWVAGLLREDELCRRHCLAALAVRPRSMEPRHFLGIVRSRAGDPEGALAAWRDGVERNPAWAHGWRHIGDALAEIGREGEAEAAFRAGMESNPEAVGIRIAYGVALRERRRYEEAAEQLNRAVELAPESMLARYERGTLLSQTGDPDGAEKEYRRVLELDPDDLLAARCWNNLALLLRAAGRKEDAFETIGNAIRIAPEESSIRVNLSLVLGDLEDWDGAVQAAEKAHVLDRDSPMSWAQLAHAYFGRAQRTRPPDPDDLASALHWYRKAEDCFPDDAVFHVNFGNALTYARQFDDAVAVLEKAVDLDPRNVGARTHLGNALNWTGRHAEAIEVLEPAKVTYPRSFQVRYGLGLAHSSLHHLEAAIDEYRAAVDLDPEKVLAQYGLGTVLWHTAEKKNLEEALLHFREALSLDPGYAPAMCNLGWCLRDLGRWGEAVVQFRKCVQIGAGRPGGNPDFARYLAETERMAGLEPTLDRLVAGESVEVSPEDRAYLAVMLRARGRHDRSVRCFEAAFRADPSLMEYERKHLYRAIWTAAEGGAPHRGQALEWCRSYVGQIGAHLADDPARVVGDLNGLRTDRALAPIREDRSAGWREFWAGVEDLHERAKRAAE